MPPSPPDPILPGRSGPIRDSSIADALDVLGDGPPPALPSGSAKSSFPVRPCDPRESSLFGDGRCVLVAEILGLLSTLSKSGLVWVTTARERFLIQLQEGRIVYAQSDRPPVGSRLGELLVTNGALDEAALADAITSARDAGQPLGAWLLAANRVAPAQLHAALAHQVQQVFNRMFAAPDSTYQFEEGKQIASTDDVRLNVVQLLLESARAHDERVELPFPIGAAHG